MARASYRDERSGIVRVSQKKGREGESFDLLEDRDRIRPARERDGLQLARFSTSWR